ncbi:hypothetical protein ACFVW1_44945 [Streptomyces olivochromogenes]|uniref:hypothetical protein n=1 Tax=Streptomyces olivochromogenes TaxID=1963 RepID=UPI0036DEA43C
MKFKLGRRIAVAGATAALAVGTLALSTGSASANSYINVPLSTAHGVGLYSGPSTSGTYLRDTNPLFKSHGDSITAVCWVIGQQIGNDGDVWYMTSQANFNWYGYSDFFPAPNPAWTFAPYVDGANAFHNGLNHC